ncbi:hypothetical protein D5086_029066 [Populus alba]|uniref:Uncharacterized protein n=1 Tax=Populus alba TaxID=43335 RepID=A0ACC4AT17_POPAL
MGNCCVTPPGIPDHEKKKHKKKQNPFALDFGHHNGGTNHKLIVIAEHLSVEEVAGIKEGFQLMDTGNKGKINIDELRVGLQKLGQQVPETDLQILMEVGDADRDGYLDYGEFVAITVHLRKMGNDEHLRKAFEFFDQNQSGHIEIDELRDALADEVDGSNEDVINAIIHDVDTDKKEKGKQNR